MKIAIYRWRKGESTGKIKWVHSVDYSEFEQSKMDAYNANDEMDSIVELHEATDLDLYFISQLENKKMVDKGWLENIESIVEDVLDEVRSLQREIGDKK